MRTALPAVKKSLNSTVLLYCDTFLLIFITNESESYVKHFNCNAVFFFFGGGAIWSKIKPIHPPPVNHGQVYK